MASYNKVILLGNLTRDPELSVLPSGTNAVDFGMAINRRWKDQGGQQREDVCFVDCKAFGKTGDNINKYMRKGKQLLVEGRLHFEQWQAKDGSKRSKHRVIVEAFQFMPDAKDQQAPPPASSNRNDYTPPPDDVPPSDDDNLPIPF
jgi:single-strand DNA-binding protein